MDFPPRYIYQVDILGTLGFSSVFPGMFVSENQDVQAHHAACTLSNRKQKKTRFF